MADEGVREIQLDGKQLVFLFMSATVVAVVIFLCGVMVGRGAPLRVGQGVSAEEFGLDPTVRPEDPGAQLSANADGPVASNENLSYNALLDGRGSSVDTLTPPSESPEPSPAEPVEPPSKTPAASSPKPAATGPPRSANVPPSRAVAPVAPAAARSLAEPKGSGYVVQVAAVPKREEANAIARRLGSKGYPAFVTTSGSNFRVRVGKYPNRREADAVANKLEREERIEPWVTR
ncbi:MAG: SPOR domain-containing protein [Acidobacteria bacterium]|nr:SPOR domain-containing protein [Acidobacteriota bacterium]